MKLGIARQPNWIARRQANFKAFVCVLDEAHHRVGSEPASATALRYGVPLLTLVMLVAALLVSLLVPDSGSGPSLIGTVLVVIAGLPWIRWLVLGDDGPTLTNTLYVLLPIAALGIGQWFVEPIGLGSMAAYPLLAFPCLFLILLGVSVAARPLALGICGLGYLAFNGPLLAAWIADREVTTNSIATWNVIFLLGIVTGYAIRMSFDATAAVNQTHEVLAQQSVDEERRRISRDVHDVVAHTLAVTMLHITAARMAVNRQDTASAASALEIAEHHGRESMNDIRRMVRLLRSDNLAESDLAHPGLSQIEQMIERYRAAGLAVKFNIVGVDRDVPPNAELAIYRIVQEALSNAAKHGSGPAEVDVRMTSNAISARIANPVLARPTASVRGSGVLGMKERIATVGGSLTAGMHQGQWIVSAELPLGNSS